MRFPSPFAIKQSYLLREPQNAFIRSSRQQAQAIVQRTDARYVCLVGPCSIHDWEATLDYAKRLKKFAEYVEESLFLIMRVFCEKSRTAMGWKGWLCDPDLDGTNDLEKGIILTRQLLLELANMHIPCAAEFVNPLAAPYYADLITWGFIGARTVTSQPHRILASSFDFPIGLKNTLSGDIDAAIKAILVARDAHHYLSIDEEGSIAAQWSRGNPFAHLVLRGSETQPNYDPSVLRATQKMLQQHHLPPYFLVDCSHGNSGKDHRKQGEVLHSLLRVPEKGLLGFMLESHLYEGNQATEKSTLQYGRSITDGCMGWEETEALLLSYFDPASPKLVLPSRYDFSIP
jgi:3-deoxy-7-phosphoheptulonate synthase